MKRTLSLTRRDFLRLGTAGAGALALSSGRLSWAAKPYDPFTMGIQSYSLRHFKRDEMLKGVRDLGLKDLEGWDGHFSVTDDPKQLDEYRNALKAAGIRMPTFGVVGFGGDAAANRRTFEFAKAMKIRTLSADPSPESMDSVEALVKEFNIKIAIHNHGPGNRFSLPDALYKAIEGRDNRIGACVDTGHYLRSDVDPVEVVKHLGPRVHGVHLKDVKVVNGEHQFTEVGKGGLKVVALLRALEAAKFKGLMSLEYEEHEENPMPYMKECLENTRQALRQIRMDKLD